MKETTVRVGQRWRYQYREWAPSEFEILGRSKSGAGWRFGERPGEWLTDGAWTDPKITMTLIADAPAEVKPVERDWTPWLPMKALPTTEGARGVPGQVWAFRGNYDDGTVFRLTSGGNVVLASRMHSYHVGDTCCLTPEGGCTVLVQDVNESEPRDPRVLYGEAPEARKEGAVTGNSRPLGLGAVPPPPSGTHACRLGAACTHHCPPPSVPWAFMTDFDLLPDV